jgi:hypothetical protein
MRHHATSAFWDCYKRLPAAIQQIADKNYELLQRDLNHPSLHFKKVGIYRSVRVGIAYRALGIEDGDTVVWFWIGSHDEYERLLNL